MYEHLHRTRQDLLTPFLGRRAFSGRFSTGQTRFVLPFTAGFTRWTLRQQQVFAATLIELSRDDQRDTLGVWTAMSQLAALPSPVARMSRPPLPLARLSGQNVEDRPLARLRALAGLQSHPGSPRPRAAGAGATRRGAGCTCLAGGAGGRPRARRHLHAAASPPRTASGPGTGPVAPGARRAGHGAQGGGAPDRGPPRRGRVPGAADVQHAGVAPRRARGPAAGTVEPPQPGRILAGPPGGGPLERRGAQ